MRKNNRISKEEKEFLEQYDVTKFERPSVTADIVIFTLDDSDELNILLIKRGGFPYKDHWAIPGGFLEAGKEYILRETKAPAGHTVAADVVFTVSTDGKEDTVNMYDTPTTVSIRKVAK